MITAIAVSDLPKNTRPPCPECGDRPMSQAHFWTCPSCGKKWSKVLRQPPIDFSKRPVCVYCGKQHLTKWSDKRWRCQDCGRVFKR